VRIGKLVRQEVMMMTYLDHGLLHNGANEYAEIGAHYVHHAQHGRVFAKVDHNVGVLEYEERLQEDEEHIGDLGDYGEDENELAVLDDAVIVHIRLDHLNHAQTPVDHGANAEHGDAHAHVQLASAILVVVSVVELGQVGRWDEAVRKVAQRVHK
jgi:hypothetical protein